MNKELKEALDVLEKEKEISKETLFEAIENSLLTACKQHFGKADNVKVEIDRDTCDFLCYAEKEVVPTQDDVEDECLQIALEDAKQISHRAQVGDIIHVEIKSKEFGRIATQNAKNVILQKIREEERSVVYNQYFEKEKDVVTGVVQRYLGRNISINLGKADAILNESEQVKGEVFKPTERIKVYILEVKNTPKGPRILVSRTHPELVKRLFEEEVTEIRDGVVEIKSIAREAGSRTKIAVWSNNPNAGIPERFPPAPPANGTVPPSFPPADQQTAAFSYRALSRTVCRASAVLHRKQLRRMPRRSPDAPNTRRGSGFSRRAFAPPQCSSPHSADAPAPATG